MRDICEKIIKDPKAVTRDEIDNLIWGPEELLISNKELLEMFLRTYDLNEASELGEAEKGGMGFFNRRSNKKRNKRYYKRLKKDIARTKIYVEGDSWFQHPFIQEIFQKLDRVLKRKYALYSSAMGGEWWSNILTEGDYQPEISTIHPDVIMLSGGGNDLVGGRKISNLINKNKGYLYDFASGLNLENLVEEINKHPYLGKVMKIDENTFTNKQKEYFIFGLKVLSKEFYALMWIFELMYKYAINNIRKKNEEVKIITQGYDYPIPSYRKSFRPARILCAIGGLKNGHWLADALNTAGIDKSDHRKVMFTLIFIFNEFLISLTEEPRLGGNVFHIDARGITEEKICKWFDEMHVKPRIYKKIAKTYKECIEQVAATKKVFPVK